MVANHADGYFNKERLHSIVEARNHSGPNFSVLQISLNFGFFRQFLAFCTNAEVFPSGYPHAVPSSLPLLQSARQA